ncbi:MAG: Inner membrane protein YnjF [Chlamydiae bacterium]|nr:Inner membrane protein YnjF [Chlamydiota bacterium]
MIDSYYRSPYQRLFLQPLIERGLFDALSPKSATALALLAGVLIPLFLMAHQSYLAFLSLLVSGFFDTLDGSLARHKNQTSPQGAVVDIASDRLVEFSIVLGLYLYAPLVRGLPCLLILGSVFFCVTTFLVVGIFQENSSEKSFHYSPGIIERGEAFIFFSLMILLPSFFTPLALLFTGLVFLTSFLRIKKFFKVV